MAQRISPQYYEHSVKWKAQCNSQQKRAGDLRQHFEAQDFEEARRSLHELIETCMECHKVYRKHLLTAEEEEESS
jgi:cytochrome c556